jgi:hypothetical protein
VGSWSWTSAYEGFRSQPLPWIKPVGRPAQPAAGPGGVNRRVFGGGGPVSDVGVVVGGGDVDAEVVGELAEVAAGGEGLVDDAVAVALPWLPVCGQPRQPVAVLCDGHPS